RPKGLGGASSMCECRIRRGYPGPPLRQHRDPAPGGSGPYASDHAGIAAAEWRRRRVRRTGTETRHGKVEPRHGSRRVDRGRTRHSRGDASQSITKARVSHPRPRARGIEISQPSIGDEQLANARLRPVAHALEEDHVQTHELGGCEGHRVVARRDRLELALEDVARNGPFSWIRTVELIGNSVLQTLEGFNVNVCSYLLPAASQHASLSVAGLLRMT